MATAEIHRIDAEVRHAKNGGSPLWRSPSPAMQALERVVADVARTDIPILVLGESGTGKELLARRIHGLSHRCGEPFIKLSCAALTPESVFSLPSQAEDGTGTNGAGGHGTLLLDEICELDPVCQPRLLLILPEDGFVPMESSPVKLGGRLISITNRLPEQEIRAGRLREDLYFRINGVCLRLPPLRQRREDIPLFVDFFLEKYSAEFNRPRAKLGSASLDALVAHAWPGNIRELENVVKKIVVLGDERLALVDLECHPESVVARANGESSLSLKQVARAASRQAERELILKALAKTRWNRKRAARELRISYKALLYKLKQIGLDEPADSPGGDGR